MVGSSTPRVAARLASGVGRDDCGTTIDGGLTWSKIMTLFLVAGADVVRVTIVVSDCAPFKRTHYVLPSAAVR